MKLEVEIKEATFPRKSSEYAVVIVDRDSPKSYHLFVAHPYTSYKVQAETVAAAFRVFLEHGGAAQIEAAIKELP